VTLTRGALGGAGGFKPSLEIKRTPSFQPTIEAGNPICRESRVEENVTSHFLVAEPSIHSSIFLLTGLGNRPLSKQRAFLIAS
jgi:hypothetical protein